MIVLTRRNIYAATTLYNYSPLWAGVVAVLWKLARARFEHFVFLLGALETAGDLVTSGLIAGIRQRLGGTRGQAQYAALLFFTNPLSVLASSAHGQFDGLAMLALTAAVFVALGPVSRRRNLQTMAFLSLSLLIKHVTLFQPPIFTRRRDDAGLRLWQVGVPYVVLAVSFTPFLAAWRQIWSNVVVYGTTGAQPNGLMVLFELPPEGRLFFTGVLALAAAAAIRRGQSVALPRGALLVSLATIVFLPGFGLQYLVWPVALGALYPTPGLALYVLVGSMFHLESPVSLHLAIPVRISEVAVWLAAVIWLVTEWRKAESHS